MAAEDEEWFEEADYDSISPSALAAAMPEAEVREVGDFSVFESETPVTIPAQRSAVIPVFNRSLADIRQTLHYKHENHPSRPFRSIDFTNRTDFSLGRGVCTVFDDGTFAGNCLMPVLKPGEERLLPYALETGVSVQYETKQARETLVSLEIEDGVCYSSRRYRRESRYHLKNGRDRSFRLILDHDFLLPEPEAEATQDNRDETIPVQPLERLESGLRYEIELPEKADFVIVVEEQTVTRSRMALFTSNKVNLDWLKTNLVETNGPLSSHPGIRECLQIQEELEGKKQDIKAAIEKTEQLITRQQRLRENIKAGGQDELTHRWRTELDEAEQELRRIEEEQIPSLRAEEQEIQNRLRAAMKSLSAEWSEKA